MCGPLDLNLKRFEICEFLVCVRVQSEIGGVACHPSHHQRLYGVRAGGVKMRVFCLMKKKVKFYLYIYIKTRNSSLSIHTHTHKTNKAKKRKIRRRERGRLTFLQPHIFQILKIEDTIYAHTTPCFRVSLHILSVE